MSDVDELLASVEKVESVSLNPGDVLLVTLARDGWTADRADQIRHFLQRLIPDNEVAVVSADVTVEAIRPAREPAPDSSWIEFEPVSRWNWFRRKR